MSRSTGLPQHLLVVDLRQENAERIIGLARKAGLAVRTTRADSLEMALRQAETGNPDLVILSADGPAGWSFEGAMEELTKAGHNPLVVSDRCDDLILSRAYISGAQGVVPATAAEALVSAIRWCLGVAADRSALAKAEAIQAETSSREESLLDSSRDPVAYIHEGMHIRANRAYLDFFGLEDMDEIDGLPFLDLVSPEFSATAKAILKAAARGEIPDNGIELSMASPTRGSIPTQVEIANASYEGEPCLQVTLRSAASDLEPADTQSSSMLAQKWWDSVRDIAEKETNSALVLAYMDNPEEIFSSVPIQYRGNMPNQLYEQMLIAATTATSGNGAFSSLVDLGGGTYGLLFSATNADADATMGQAKTFKDLLGDVTVILGDQALKPGFSVSGVAIGKKIGWSSTPEAISMAERGIPKAKKSSGFCWFDPSTQDREEMRRRRDLTDLVRKACSTEDGLVLHYRPILPLAGPSTHIYEAFVRMIGANGELMYPQDFMGVVAEAGLSRLLDDWVARAASRAVQAKKQKGQDVKLLITMCAETLIDPASANQFLAAVELSPSGIIVQLPEPLIQAHMAQATSFRNQLKSLGADFCVSRFGHSHASRALLAALHPEWAKFDKSWSGDDIKNPERQKSLKELISDVHAAGASSIADFVLDSTSMSALFSAGVNHASGDFISLPMETMDADFSQ